MSNEWAASRKLEWEAELRFIRQQKIAAERRIAELEEMLATFFPEVRS